MTEAWEREQASKAWGDRYAAPLLLGGVLAAALFNWRQWRQDRRAGQQLAATTMDELVLRQTPLVSILLPAWNEAAHLAACLASIQRLRYPAIELIICAGGQDESLRLAQAAAGPNTIVLEQQPGDGKQRALQRCWEQASGAVIFLTDADCVLDDECFERTLAPVINGVAPAATGSRRPLARQLGHPLVAYQLAYHLYMQGTFPAASYTLDGVIAAIRREALEQIGGFTAQAPIGTDYYLDKQLREAGYQVQFVRNSRVQTEYLTRPREYVRQQSRWFRNRFVHGRRFRAWNEVLAHLRAGVGALFMLGVPLLGGLRSRLLWSAWLVAACHLGLSMARFTRFAQRFGGLQRLHPWRYPLFALYMGLNWIATARGFVESLLPSLRGRW